MRVYRPTYKDRGGSTKAASRWAIEFRDAQGAVRRMMAFTDRAASESCGRKLERLAELRAVDEPLPPALSAWAGNLPTRMRGTLVRFGLLTEELGGSGLIEDRLAELASVLRARERTAPWIRRLQARARETLAASGARTLSQVKAFSVEQTLKHFRDEGMSAREANHRLQACKEFTRWAVAGGLLTRDPLAPLRPVNARLDPRHVRRALRQEELQALVRATHEDGDYRGAPGPLRALAWRLAAEAGLRVGEICALQVRDLELDAPGGAVLVVRPEASKNRTEARLPLASALAADLTRYTAGKLPLATLLGLPRSFRDHATRWLRHDLALAKLPYKDAAGRIADVHALRSAFVTRLVRSGANVKALQTLARHSDARLSVGLYARLSAHDERAAIDALPSLAPDSREQNDRRAAGTDANFVLASCLACEGSAECRGVPPGAGAASNGAVRKAVGAEGVVEAKGVEPSTFALRTRRSTN
jgi:integrase/recombinase XerD